MRIYYTITLILSIILLSSYSINANINNCYNKNVIDGDTLWVMCNDAQYKIRLIGIQAPELFRPTPWPLANQAKRHLVKLVTNQRLSIQIVGKDKYNRALANIYTDKMWINSNMLSSGYAFLYLIKDNIPKVTQLYKSEDIARRKHRNIWKIAQYQTISTNDAHNYIGEYKIIQSKAYGFTQSKKYYYIQLTHKGKLGLSIRLSKTKSNIKYIKKLLNKNLEVRGYINQYSKYYGPTINAISKKSIKII